MEVLKNLILEETERPSERMLKLEHDDIYSLNLLQPLLCGSYLPFTGSSLRPFCLVHILNDIIVNRRQTILEFGAGISTIMIGRLIKRNGLPAKLVSVEHDPKWIGAMRSYIVREELEDVVEIIHAPLTACHLSTHFNLWYDTSVLDYELADSYDMVIIDGPPAWEENKQEARFPALPYIFDRLSGHSSVYLDDANRAGERSIIERWEEDYGLEFSLAGKTLAYATIGHSFHTEPIQYYSV
jgi:hypothetical protein